MKQDIFDTNPLALYEYLLLKPLTQIYSARLETELNDWMIYSNRLIDKFAIQSSSFFHLSDGIIEHRKSGEKKRMNGLDIFTTNTIFRTLVEAYLAFNHIFVEPKTDNEKYFRFLLWKLDGLYQEKKYDIKLTDFNGIEEILENRENQIASTISEIRSSEFIKAIPENHLHKIFDPEKRKARWRFLVGGNKVKVLQIIGLVEHCCKTRGFINMYKYSSLHTHSNFPSVNEFNRIRGKILSTEYRNPIIKLAILLTCLFIYDICEIDQNSKKVFDNMDLGVKNFIIEITKSIKRTQI